MFPLNCETAIIIDWSTYDTFTYSYYYNILYVRVFEHEIPDFQVIDMFNMDWRLVQ